MRSKPEVLAPAGSFDALRAAIAGGADAVYMGGSAYGARAYAKNFDDEEMARAVAYAHERGVKCYIAVNTLITDRELPAVKAYIKRLCAIGVDAVILQDMGLAALVAEWAPALHRHASTQMAVHNLEGVRTLAALGFTRVVVARELTRKNLMTIVQNSPVEIEYFVHGSLCYSHSGQCLMSAVIGRRSANRGRCAGPCRLPCSVEGGKSKCQMSLKDLCMADYLAELARMGVASLKIEGRMKRPEYVSSVTRAYANALRYGVRPTREEIANLAEIFSRSGFTAGYYEGETGRDMFGKREEEAPAKCAPALERERRRIEEGLRAEVVRQPVRFTIEIKEKLPVRLTARTEGAEVTVTGAAPEPARNRPITGEEVCRQLAKTGGTAYYTEEVAADIDDGQALPLSAINALRREALALLDAGRLASSAPAFSETESAPPENVPQQETDLVIGCRYFGQIPPHLSGIEAVFLPAGEIAARAQEAAALAKQVRLGVMMPRVVMDDEREGLSLLLRKAADAGATLALCGNIGQFKLAEKYGFTLWGDIGLNVFNGRSAEAYRQLGLERLLLSPELSAAQIRDLPKPLSCGIFAYGRLPLMVAENCLAKAGTGCSGRCKLPIALRDRQGESFPVLPEPHCRNLIANSKTLYLADKQREMEGLNLGWKYLFFTDETQDTCAEIIAAYRGGPAAKPEHFTRGLFQKGVE